MRINLTGVGKQLANRRRYSAHDVPHLRNPDNLIL
jgi:hypothetical protein